MRNAAQNFAHYRRLVVRFFVGSRSRSVQLICLGLILILGNFAVGQERKFPAVGLEITRPVISEDTTVVAKGPIKVGFKVSAGTAHKVRLRVEAGENVAAEDLELGPEQEHVIRVNLFRGKNTITLSEVLDAAGSRELRSSIQVTCDGPDCRGALATGGENGASSIVTQTAQVKRPVQSDSNQRNQSTQTERPDTGRQDSADTSVSSTRKDRSQDSASATGTVKPRDSGKKSAGAGDAAATTGWTIEFDGAKKGDHFRNVSEIPLELKFTRAKDLKEETLSGLMRVLNKGMPVPQRKEDESFEVKFEDKGPNAKGKVNARLGQGQNEITVFLRRPAVADKAGNKDEEEIITATLEVNCDGKNCGTPISALETNSQNTRIVVGLEQVGGSSSGSETKPFMDLFFTAPLAFSGGGRQLPRLSSWGQIRLGAKPDQIASIAALPTNLVNLVSATETGQLIQTFDFLAGIEYRPFPASGVSYTLLPGVRQQTHFYFAGGFGAVSPLSSSRESVQLLKVPTAGSSQAVEFANRYRTIPEGTEFIGFVFPERDRFLRQWYAGLRLKSFYCEDHDCNHLMNRFPAILDIMVGQSEAVTGGSFKYRPLDADESKNLFVVRFDASYPLPIQKADYLFLFGSATLKVGGGGLKISEPLFLEPAPDGTALTGPKVFIAPVLQPNRDSYRIGVGVNLSTLFNRSNK